VGYIESKIENQRNLKTILFRNKGIRKLALQMYVSDLNKSKEKVVTDFVVSVQFDVKIKDIKKPINIEQIKQIQIKLKNSPNVNAAVRNFLTRSNVTVNQIVNEVENRKRQEEQAARNARRQSFIAKYKKEFGVTNNTIDHTQQSYDDAVARKKQELRNKLRNKLKKNIENSKSLTAENRRMLLSKLNDAGTRKNFEKKTIAFDKMMGKIQKSKYLTDDQKKFLSTLGNISEAQKRFEALEAFEKLKTKAKKNITKMQINSREYLQQINLSRTKNEVSKVIQEAEKRAAFEKKAREFEKLKTKAKKQITKMKINNPREYLQQINDSRTKNEVSKVIEEAEKRELLEQFKKKQKAQVSDLKMLPAKNKDNYLKNIDGATSERQVEAAVKGARNTDEKLRKKEESLRKVAKSWLGKSKYENALSV
jgi:hypothetical protein